MFKRAPPSKNRVMYTPVERRVNKHKQDSPSLSYDTRHGLHHQDVHVRPPPPLGSSRDDVYARVRDGAMDGPVGGRDHRPVHSERAHDPLRLDDERQERGCRIPRRTSQDDGQARICRL